MEDWDFYVRLLASRMLRDSEPVMLMHADAGAAPHGRPLEPDSVASSASMKSICQRFPVTGGGTRRGTGRWRLMP